ncbi:hypothetical protein MLD38_011403 [Melastoma candidum]|uniref:Uncharacterized protein n=1 Tax=Melastoma candidum TaxID=119954 RepID=A0ACB9R2D5_9MYRT|nr:hypothetical protein MLD38_011403 [Melastoma candidum]
MLLSSLEKYLPPQLLSLPHDSKANYMRDILLRYSPEGEGTRVLKHRDHRQRMLASYKVENSERWVHDANFRIMRQNTVNRYGAVLDDFGKEGILSKMMDDFVRPIAKVLFPHVGVSTLDSHHGFIVEYGMYRDVELGEQFSGGELFFRSVRCDKHINSEVQSEEVLDYCHVPGYAVLHRGRHRHGARATTSGCRVNLILWCRRGCRVPCTVVKRSPSFLTIIGYRAIQCK